MKQLSFAIAWVFLCTQLHAQKATEALAKYAAQNPSEKIYLHYDKEYYVAGETIWFKAYLFSENKPSGLSSNLFLQFCDSKGRVIANNRYPVLGAVAKGSIGIPDSLPQGDYLVRAWTQSMLNFDQGLIYRKNIFVGRPNQNTNGTSSGTISLQFFPESGYLVDGIVMTTAFKAIDQTGLPVEINGLIKTEDGTTIAPFSTYHDGMGRVTFKPVAGKKYSAEVQTAAGLRTYFLPEVKAAGINLKITSEKGGKRIELSRAAKDAALFDDLLLVAEINNEVVFENEISFEDYPSVVGHIVTDSLPSGILHFTVFNKDRVPIAERLSFINNDEYRAGGTISSTKFSADKRSLNELELSFPQGMQRSCSVAVTDVSGFSFNDDENIYSRLLLTSDLKGYVHNPAWYFEGPADSAKMAVDNLLLTQGWSRFSWAKILSGEMPDKKFQETPFISIRGVVRDINNKQLLTGGKLNFYISAGDSTETTYEVPVNDKGEFKMDSLVFSGPSAFYYGYTDSKERQRPAIITLVNNQTVMPPAESGKENILNHSGALLQNQKEIGARYDYMKARMDEVKEMEKVTVQAKTKKKPLDIVNEKYTSGVFREPGKENLDNINEPANDKSLSVVDYIKNSIQQVQIQNGQFVNRKNMSLMSGRNWLVGVFLDEQPTSISLLRTLRVQDIALIKFWEAGFVGVGSEFPGGAIAVYTKDKSKEGGRPDQLDHFDYAGYTIVREFYSPAYDRPQPGSKSLATDSRSTLYWNPDTYTGLENKPIKIQFYNNDFAKKFKVVVEGVDENGKLIHLEKIIDK